MIEKMMFAGNVVLAEEDGVNIYSHSANGVNYLHIPKAQAVELSSWLLMLYAPLLEEE